MISFIAIVMIVWHHLLLESYTTGGSGIETVLNFTHPISDSGVDIFFFISGFGIYYALGKKPSLSQFYKRRLTRILPLVTITTLLIYLTFCREMTYIEIISNITSVGFWIGDGYQFFWFIQLLLPLYLLSPVFYNLIEKGRKSHFLIAIIVFSTLFTISSFGNYRYTLIAPRIPLYIVGMLFGKMSFENKKILGKFQGILIALSAVSLIVLYIIYVVFDYQTVYFYYGGKYILYITLVPGIILLFAKIFTLNIWDYKLKLLKRIISFIGANTLGIYVFHIWMLLNPNIPYSDIIDVSNVFTVVISFVLMAIVLIIVGTIYEYVVDKIVFLGIEKKRARV